MISEDEMNKYFPHALEYEDYLGDMTQAQWDKDYKYDRKFGDMYDKQQNKLEHLDAEAIATNLALVELRDKIIEFGIENKASNFRIVGEATFGYVSYKLDGKWGVYRLLHPSSVDPLIITFRDLAGLNLKDRGAEIKGSISYKYKDDVDDLRVTISPSIYTQVLTIRRLNAKELRKLEDIGYNAERELPVIKRKMKQINGLILLVGSMESGKSSSMYSMVKRILKESHGTKSAMSIENPVDVKVPGIIQAQVDELHGFGYANATSVRMREAGDILIQGEINDADTAKLTVDLATTGQLVFSTLHSDSAMDAPLSLMTRSKGTVDVEMLGNSLKLILFHILANQLCSHCKEEYTITTDDMRWIHAKLGENVQLLNLYVPHIYDEDDPKDQEKGRCPYCGGTGFHDKILLSEMVDCNRLYKEALRKTNCDPIALKKVLQGDEYSNYYPLEDDVIRRLQQGYICLDQAKSYID